MFSQSVQLIIDFFMKYGTPGLFILSFIESSFFPVPPDIMLIGLSLANPRLALWYALITTMASVLGGLFGYWIGLKAGRPILRRVVSEKMIFKVENLFSKYGGWAVAIAGLTPIPYKVFTIGAGLFRINILVFACASLLGRSIRFFLEGALILFIGARAQELIYNYFEEFTIGVATIAIVLYLYLKNKKSKS